MNHEPEIIRARFVEAAFTERFLPSALMPSGKGYWPQIFHDKEDQDGWDDAAKLDNAERRKGRATSDAISRHQECLDWTASLIDHEEHRHILWAWAFCRANSWDFGARCNRKGWKRPTAYRRRDASIEAISGHFGMKGLLVRLPDDKWLRHETASVVPIHGGLEHCAGSSPAIKFIPGYRTEPSRDMLKTEEQVDAFAKFMERRNADMRRMQEREAKRRAKLGLDAA